MSEALITAVAALGFPVVGRSSRGRAIHARRFGGGSMPPVVVVGGVHGDEPASVAAVVELCRSLDDWKGCPLWVMPVMNPDGVAAGTKNSATDVDLNRNFPAGNFTVQHAPGYCPGSHPLSEPESRALAALV